MTVRVKVRFFTTLREIVGKQEVGLKFKEPITIADLLSLLVKRYGVHFKNYIYGEDGEVRSFLQFLVNGRSITSLEGFKTRLKNGDIVAIISPVGGG
jgi:molybdopterin synthase sulfur carrier subunit